MPRPSIPLLLIGLLVSGVLAACGDDDGPRITTEAITPASPETADIGTLTVAIEDWEGVEGYRLFATVWSGRYDELVGGVFWTHVDSDPFTAEDVVHPVADGNEAGFEDDYAWDETATLEPGMYSIDLYANPVELAPFGSHLPAEPIERRCLLDVEIEAGSATTVVVTDIPSGEVEICPGFDS